MNTSTYLVEIWMLGQWSIVAFCGNYEVANKVRDRQIARGYSVRISLRSNVKDAG